MLISFLEHAHRTLVQISTENLIAGVAVSLNKDSVFLTCLEKRSHETARNLKNFVGDVT